MACTALTKGRVIDCNRVTSGIKYVYFLVYDEVTSITSATGTVTDIDMVGSNDAYRYSTPRGVSSMTETITGSTENGTVFYTPSLTLILNRLTKEDQNQIKLLAQTRVFILAQLNATNSAGKDIICLLGTVNGMSLNAGTEVSGAAWGDRNGYELTFDGMETEPFPILTDYTSAPLDNIDSGGAIPIVSS
jgi:hypothetical protein